MIFNRRVFLSFLFLLTVLLSAYSQTEKPRIAVIGLKNTSRDEVIESVCESVTDTIELTLQLLNKYRIIRADYIDVYTDFEEAKKFFYDFNIDNAIFGTYLSERSGEYSFEISVYDRSRDRVTIQRRIDFTSILDSFEKAEELAINVLEEFSDEHIAFGRLIFTNEGGKGDYEVILDNNLVLKNPVEAKVLTGSHYVEIRRIIENGFEEVFSQIVSVEEARDIAVSFSLFEDKTVIQKEPAPEPAPETVPKEDPVREAGIPEIETEEQVFFQEHPLDYYLFEREGSFFTKYNFEGKIYKGNEFSLREPLRIIEKRPYLNENTKGRINKFFKIGMPSVYAAITGSAITAGSLVFLALGYYAPTFIVLGSGLVISFSAVLVGTLNSPFRAIESYNDLVKKLYYQ